MNTTDEKFMNEAILLAKEAAADDEAPIGAIIVRDGVIVGRGRNRREKDKNALGHAEIEAINDACKTLGGWRLIGCTMYVTLEPCPMCTGAIINSRIERVVFGAYDKKAGSCGSLINLFDLPYNHKPQLSVGFMEEECAHLLSDFFKRLRKK
ncbi:MAG: tRNA adenosine(34) deaminase TadA [Clostridia bacterium]|nr:tRNA adenosine(34) deaminase TadA [Clostridia bacterium]